MNFDAVAPEGYAWFVAKGPPEYLAVGGTNYWRGGPIRYRRLQWTNDNTSAQWADANWWTLPEPANQAPYRDYYDLDGTNRTIVPVPQTGISAPQQGGSTGIDLHLVGSRLMMAAIRDRFLWTCHHVGLAGTNGTYNAEDQTGTNVDRAGVQWFKLRINSAGEPLTCDRHGRIYDDPPTNAFYYYFPSLMVNCAGDVLLGFSGSSVTNYIGAYYSWCAAACSTAVRPRLLKGGKDYYSVGRWGDYSYTTLDPTDSLTFWTVQQYAEEYLIEWGTWIAKITRVP